MAATSGRVTLSGTGFINLPMNSGTALKQVGWLLRCSKLLLTDIIQLDLWAWKPLIASPLQRAFAVGA